MTKFIFILLLVICTPAQAKINIVTTTQDIAAIAKFITGDTATVTSLTKGTRDPHFAQAKPSMIRRVYSADLLILIGADLEIAWLPALLRSGRNSKILPGETGYLDLSKAINLLGKPTAPIDRSMGDVHEMGNPHYWLDPQNGLLMAKTITMRLTQLAPGQQEFFEHKLQNFELQLTQKLPQWQSTLAPLRGVKIISYHNSFLYLSKAFGFEIVNYIEPKPGISPSAAHLNALVKQIKHDRIPMLIMEPFYEQKSADYLHQQTGIKRAVLPQSVGAKKHIQTYFDLFDDIVKNLQGAIQ